MRNINLSFTDASHTIVNSICNLCYNEWIECECELPEWEEEQLFTTEEDEEDSYE